MARKTRRQRTRGRTTPASQTVQQNKRTQEMDDLINLDKSINRGAGFIINFGIFFILPTIVLSISLYYYFGRNSFEKSGLSETLGIFIIVLTVILIVSLLIIMSADITAKIAKLPQTDEERRRKLTTSLRTITVIFLHTFISFSSHRDTWMP